MKTKSLTTLALGLTGFLALSTVTARAEDYVEPGRFGIEGTLSTNGFQIGPAYEGDKFEAVLDLDAYHSSTAGVVSGDVGLELRGGKRFNLGTFNYLSIGADVQTSVFSKQAGVSNNGSFIVGPYLGIQRHFSGTNIMLTMYVIVADFNYTPGLNGGPSTTSIEVFQEGAFGMTYLF